jgi:hypothetical protein
MCVLYMYIFMYIYICYFLKRWHRDSWVSETVLVRMNMLGCTEAAEFKDQEEQK